MKALETLKEFQKDIKAYLNSFGEDDIRDEEYLNASSTAVKINEAIKELEELSNRSCDGCFWCENYCEEICSVCLRNEDINDMYEKKDSE